jgi:hypothetical protein
MVIQKQLVSLRIFEAGILKRRNRKRGGWEFVVHVEVTRSGIKDVTPPVWLIASMLPDDDKMAERPGLDLADIGAVVPHFQTVVSDNPRLKKFFAGATRPLTTVELSEQLSAAQRELAEGKQLCLNQSKQMASLQRELNDATRETEKHKAKVASSKLELNKLRTAKNNTISGLKTAKDIAVLDLTKMDKGATANVSAIAKLKKTIEDLGARQQEEVRQLVKGEEVLQAKVLLAEQSATRSSAEAVTARHVLAQAATSASNVDDKMELQLSELKSQVTSDKDLSDLKLESAKELSDQKLDATTVLSESKLDAKDMLFALALKAAEDKFEAQQASSARGTDKADQHASELAAVHKAHATERANDHRERIDREVALHNEVTASGENHQMQAMQLQLFMLGSMNQMQQPHRSAQEAYEYRRFLEGQQQQLAGRYRPPQQFLAGPGGPQQALLTQLSPTSTTVTDTDLSVKVEVEQQRTYREPPQSEAYHHSPHSQNQPPQSYYGQSHYEPPPPHNRPPQSYYGQSHYGQSHFGPPQSHYEPPQSHYGHPHYGPPQSHYGPNQPPPPHGPSPGSQPWQDPGRPPPPHGSSPGSQPWQDPGRPPSPHGPSPGSQPWQDPGRPPPPHGPSPGQGPHPGQPPHPHGQDPGQPPHPQS